MFDNRLIEIREIRLTQAESWFSLSSLEIRSGGFFIHLILIIEKMRATIRFQKTISFISQSHSHHLEMYDAHRMS